jgi:PBSX family phage terminase large subunit
MNIALTEPQEKFVFSKEPHPAMVAGLGAGKSQAALIRLILKMLAEPGINTAYMMPTYDLIRLRAMPGAEEVLDAVGISYTTNRSEYRINVHGYGDIIFRSYERPERIVAYEVAHSITDELDTLNKEKASFVWRKVSERNRQKCKGINTTGNVTTPDQGINGFTYDRWHKNPKEGYELIKAPTSSNPFLPDGYIEQIRANYDPILADLYLLGEFVSLTQGKVYHYFDRVKHHADRILTDDDKRIYVGLDFNIGGCCAVVAVTEKSYPVFIDEFTAHDTQAVITHLQATYPDKKITVHPDASGKAGRTNASLSDIGLIQQAGIEVDAPNANPAVRDRVNAVNALLAHNNMKVNTDKCPELTHALESQGYIKGEPEKFDSHPAIDDWNDGAGYLINRRYPVVKPAVGTLRYSGSR